MRRLKELENLYRLYQEIHRHSQRSYQLRKEPLYRLSAVLYQEQNARFYSGAFEIKIFLQKEKTYEQTNQKRTSPQVPCTT